MKAIINITPAAAAHIKKCLASTAYDKIRVGIKPAGCSGYQYLIEYAPRPAAGDLFCEGNGVTVLIDPKASLYLTGSTLDYVTEGLQSGLKFNNPNVTAQCGCGESFTLDAR